MSNEATEGLIPLLHELSTSTLTIPDELTENILKEAGAECSDDRSVRLASLAAQKFLSDVIEDAKIIAKNRSEASLAVQKAEGYQRTQDKDKDKRAILLTEDLTRALAEYGIKLQKPPYHVDSSSNGGGAGGR